MIALAFVIVDAYVSAHGQPWSGTILGGVGLGGIVTAFIVGRNKQNSHKEPSTEESRQSHASSVREFFVPPRSLGSKVEWDVIPFRQIQLIPEYSIAAQGTVAVAVGPFPALPLAAWLCDSRRSDGNCAVCSSTDVARTTFVCAEACAICSSTIACSTA